MRSIYGQQLFRSLRAHQRSSNQMKILTDKTAQTTTRVVGVAYIYIYANTIQQVGKPTINEQLSN